jgi:mycothiol synthase
MLFAYSDAKRPALEGIVAEALSQSQLEMGYPVDRLGPTLVVSTLCGYALRTYQAGDESAWYLLMERAGFGLWNAERLRSWIARIPPESWFMALDGQSGAIVATAMGLHDHSDRHPFGAQLGWVAVAPYHRRKGLGTAVCASVTARLIHAGYRDIHLYTEDFRVAALALYLKLGYQPFIYAPDLVDRWRHVCDAVNWAFTPDAWPLIETRT